jgi:hypothetical protein
MEKNNILSFLLKFSLFSLRFAYFFPLVNKFFAFSPQKMRNHPFFRYISLSLIFNFFTTFSFIEDTLYVRQLKINPQKLKQYNDVILYQLLSVIQLIKKNTQTKI